MKQKLGISATILYSRRMRINSAIIGFALCLGMSQEAKAQTPSSLRDALVLHASFDKGTAADLARGDATLYSAPKIAFPPDAKAGLPESRVVTHEHSGGVTGGFLRFQKKSPEMVFYKAKGNMPFNTTNWSGTVSFWLRLDPEKDLEPGFTDPIQITHKAWNDAAFFVEFTKDEVPREFRLGAYADFNVWNPENREWNSIPMSDKPLAPVVRPPFSRDQWTHVLFTFENFNTGKPNGVSNLYLNGEKRAGLTPRTHTFSWDIDQVLIMLGLSFVGDYDELAIFDRALDADEVKAVFTSKSLKTGKDE